MRKTKTLTTIIPLVMALLILFGYQYLSSNNPQLQKPTKAPTDGNVPAPVHVGTTTQNKHGGLGAAIFKADLQVNSPKYCDKNGNNCFTVAQVNSLLSPSTPPPPTPPPPVTPPATPPATPPKKTIDNIELTRTNLITPNYTNGYGSYTGPTDVSAYQFVEVGVFDNSSRPDGDRNDGNRNPAGWGNYNKGAQSALIPVIPNTEWALNCASAGRKNSPYSGRYGASWVMPCKFYVSIDGNNNISFQPGEPRLTKRPDKPRLAYVNGLKVPGVRLERTKLPTEPFRQKNYSFDVSAYQFVEVAFAVGGKANWFKGKKRSTINSHSGYS